MKQDIDLLRKILFTIEEEYKPGQGDIYDLYIFGYDQSTIAEPLVEGLLPKQDHSLRDM